MFGQTSATEDTGGMQAYGSAGSAKHDATFLGAWLKDPLRTGAITSSSRALADLMARQADPERPGMVVELGPGTGPVTEALIRRGFPAERLLLIEANPGFQDLLMRRFPGVHVVGGDAYDIERLALDHANGPLSAIVSSLPLLTQPNHRRQKLVSDALALASSGAPFIQFTYGFKSPVDVSPGIHASRTRRIWWNLPPAAVWRYTRAH